MRRSAGLWQEEVTQSSGAPKAIILNQVRLTRKIEDPGAQSLDDQMVALIGDTVYEPQHACEHKDEETRVGRADPAQQY